jgi:molybdopterin-guanine dinucleotide biosynthesis protein A
MIERAPLKGLVLAGGNSRRMGSDKAALELEGITLLDRAVGLLRSQLDDVWVSVRADQKQLPVRSVYPLLEDRLENSGPAAGILAAHAHAPQAAWLVVACDLPLLDAATLRFLIDGRDSSLDATALVASAAADPEPLCAIYEPVTLAAFQAQASTGNLSPRAWLKHARVRLLVAPDANALRNANTDAEFQRISEQLRERAKSPSGPAYRKK